MSSENSLNPGREMSLNHHPVLEMARPIFIQWEKLRIIYNVVLVFVTLGISGSILVPQMQTAGFESYLKLLSHLSFTALCGAVIANLCFFAGPLLETYVKWLWSQFRFPRTALLIAGTLFASFLAALTITVSCFGVFLQD